MPGNLESSTPLMTSVWAGEPSRQGYLPFFLSEMAPKIEMGSFQKGNANAHGLGLVICQDLTRLQPDSFTSLFSIHLHGMTENLRCPMKDM